MKSAGKARSNGLYRHIRTSKEIIRNLLNDFYKYAAPDLYKIGICEIASSSGNLVKVYDQERCICDLIRNRNKYEVQVFQTAIKEYMSSKDKKLSQLIVYADMMGIRDEVMKYVEVLV